MHVWLNMFSGTSLSFSPSLFQFFVTFFRFLLLSLFSSVISSCMQVALPFVHHLNLWVWASWFPTVKVFFSSKFHCREQNDLILQKAPGKLRLYRHSQVVVWQKRIMLHGWQMWLRPSTKWLSIANRNGHLYMLTPQRCCLCLDLWLIIDAGCQPPPRLTWATPASCRTRIAYSAEFQLHLRQKSSWDDPGNSCKSGPATDERLSLVYSGIVIQSY